MSEVQLGAAALGITMIASVFIGLAVAMAREMGWRQVAAVYVLVAAVTGFICGACWLTTWGLS